MRQYGITYVMPTLSTLHKAPAAGEQYTRARTEQPPNSTRTHCLPDRLTSGSSTFQKHSFFDRAHATRYIVSRKQTVSTRTHRTTLHRDTLAEEGKSSQDIRSIRRIYENGKTLIEYADIDELPLSSVGYLEQLKEMELWPRYALFCIVDVFSKSRGTSMKLLRSFGSKQSEQIVTKTATIIKVARKQALISLSETKFK